MSGFRRRLMTQVANDPNALPTGCVRCEYLESYVDSAGGNGQYIDTGRKMTDTDVFGFEFSIMEGNNSKAAFGWRWAGTSLTKNHCYINTFADYYSIRFASEIPIDISFSTGKRQTIEIDPQNNIVRVNGVVYNAARDPKDAYYNGTSVYNLYIFTTNNIGTPYSGSNTRVYDYWVKDVNGNMVQHLVPILDQDGIPCMYDVVGKKFYYNARTNRQDLFRYKIAEQ